MGSDPKHRRRAPDSCHASVWGERGRCPLLSCSRRSRPGFSLIELLTVVAIIALLIGILLPSLSRARAQARTALCLSNLRQTGLAVQLYADANRDVLPQAWGGSVKWGENHGALYRIMVRSGVTMDSDEPPPVLICPEAQPRGSISYALSCPLFGYIHPPDEGFDDEDEEEVDEDSLNGTNIAPIKMGLLRTPERVVAIYDVLADSLSQTTGGPFSSDEADISDQFTGNATNDWEGVVEPSPSGFMWQRSLINWGYEAEPPHNKAHNVLFADIHVKTIRQWDPDHMTRLVGRDPNDSVLY